MIRLNVSVNDTSRSVALAARTDNDYVDFYRRVGLTTEQAISTHVPVVNGVASFVDASPPEKTLLTYYVVDSNWERSGGETAVVPSTWKLTRPALGGDIRIGNLVLNTIDDLGTVWTCSDIQGWWTLPDSEIPSQVRSRDEDGSYDDVGRYLARELTLTGVFLPKEPELLEAARARLIKELNAVRSTVALRVDETPPRQMAVRYAGKSSIDTMRQSGLTQFTVQLRAADPVKYSLDPMTQPSGVELVSTGAGSPSGSRTYPRDYDTDSDNVREYGSPGAPNQVSMVNEGNYLSPPIIRISGPVVNPRVELLDWDGKEMSAPTESMEFLITLQSGEYLEIDVKEKTVLLNGAVSRRGTMTFESDWFSLRPGTNSIRYTALSAPGQLTQVTLTAYSAWLG